MFTLAVPTEKENAQTTKIELTPPEGFAIDSFVPSPGWKREVQSTGSGEETVIQKVTWTGGNVPTEEDAVFQFLASADAARRYTFKVRQTYSDGSVVDWSGPESSDTPAPVDRGEVVARRRRKLDARDRRARRRRRSRSSSRSVAPAHAGRRRLA